MAPKIPASSPRRWGTLDDAALEATCSVKTIRRMISRGEIYAERIGARRIRVDLDSVAGRPLALVKSAR